MIIPATAQKILDAQKIELKLDRMAFQALELTYGNDELVILGIEPGGGFDLAKIIASKISKYEPAKKVEFSSIYINKPEPLKEDAYLKEQKNSQIFQGYRTWLPNPRRFYSLFQPSKYHP